MAEVDPLVLRPVRYDDPAAVELTGLVQDWYRQVYGGADDNPITADEFAPPAGGFLVGFRGAQPVAMGGWRRWTAPSPVPGARPAELRRMFVRAEDRGRGYARTVLAGLESRAEVAGCDLMILEAGERQTAALALYRRCGYRPVPAFGYYAGWAGAVHLGKRLDV